MLILLSLIALCTVCIFAWKRGRRFLFVGAFLFFFTWFLLESVTYGYFLYQAYRGDGLFLIGRQAALDAVYRARLVKAHYLSQHRENQFWVLDPTLGYTIGLNKRFGKYTSNSAGIRGTQEYSFVKPEGVVRIAALGDSFVFCDDEADEDTWEAQVEKSLTNVEVMNFGVSGYSFFQAVARLTKDVLRFNPDVVFLNMAGAFSPRELLPILGMADQNLRATDIYRARFELREGKLVSEAFYIDSFFDPSWRSEKIYQPAKEFLKSDFALPNAWDLSNLVVLAKLYLLKSVPAKAREKALAHMEDIQKDPKQKALNQAMVNYLVSLAQKYNFTLVFLFGRPGLDKPGLENPYPLPSEHVRYFAIGDQFLALREKPPLAGVNVLNESKHLNKIGNQAYGYLVTKYLLENSWRIGGKPYRFKMPEAGLSWQPGAASSGNH